MKKKNLKSVSIMLAGAIILSALPAAYAQNFRVEPGPADQHDYLCDVAKIADDLTARDLSGRSSNFWTKTARGGKFEAIEATRVRVASSAPDVARGELFAFYQKNATFVHGTFPDHGQQPIDRVVNGCVVDPSSTRGIKVASINADKYKLLLRDRDHLIKFFALNTSRLSDEQLVGLVGQSVMVPTDAFERKGFYEKEGKRIRASIAAADNGPFILQGDINLKPYNFDTGVFEVVNVLAAAESYGYTYDSYARVVPKKPIYKLSAAPGQNFVTYKPQSVDEAKKIEAARAKDGLKLRTYVQPVKAWLHDDTPEIDGIISRIEVATKDGQILFSIPSK